MAHAYTPGLRVTLRTALTKRRILPLKGKVLKQVGDIVRRDEIVARTALPGNVEIVNAVSRLGVEPDELESVMLKRPGQSIRRDELIAQTRGLFGLFKSRLYSPIDGTIESISSVTGQVLLRHTPVPLQVAAYVDGRVSGVVQDEGVEVTTQATFVQGIFGVGGETWGPLRFVADEPDQVLDPGALTPELAGAIVVGGSFASGAAIQRATEVGAKGLIIGGIHDEDLRQILGYDLGVAITGSEQIGITVVLTEGFGQIRMSERTWQTLRQRAGEVASISGATQIRAGVMRPEIIVPYDVEQEQGEPAAAPAGSAMDIGSNVRIIRQPGFGRVGVVHQLPSALEQIESETMARVLQVRFADGSTQVVPRANVELIED